MGKITQQIVDILSKSNALPTLFVGSGLSRRYLGLPKWDELLKIFADYLDKPYGYYVSEARLEINGNEDMLLPVVATKIEKDFNQVWFHSQKFEEQREEYDNEIKLGTSALKIAMADYFKKNSNKLSSRYSAEIEKLKKIGNKHISSIITTNYDLFFENCFGSDFQTYVGQNELLFSQILEMAEIYKIHGCCMKPSSIIINKQDYHNFIEKSAYLSAKLLTIFLENPILFIGYSLNDANVRRILSSIAECLDEDQLEKLKDRLVFIEWNDTNEEDTISEKTFTFENGKSITMNGIYLSDYGDLYDAILTNNVKYEVKKLRRIKEQLYELVKTNKPTDKLYIATGLEDTNDDIDFVVGVGVYSKFGQVGYKGLSLNQLYRYVLGQSDLQYDDNMLLEQTIPELYNGKSVLPVCKLVNNCDNLKHISERAKWCMKDSLMDFLSDNQKEQVKKGYFKMDLSISKYYEYNNLSKTLSKIPLMNPNEIDPDELYSFIDKALKDDSTLLSLDKAINNQSDSAMRKCIAIWDWIKYHKAAESNMKILLEQDNR